ncbi:MAG: hypothetical protein IJV01_01085 [Bacteroidales bacterium]|nr:hypothetical protein [Bacteroidales bacterium]
MRRLRPIFLLLLLPLFCVEARAQFKEEAFSQQYNDDTNAKKDSTDVMFSLRDFFGGVAHKHSIKVGTMFAGSTLFVGCSQIYNRDYWKLPVVYGGIGAGVAGGILFGREGNTRASTLCYAGAGLVWWASLMDGVVNYEPNDYPQPGKATLYALLLPGLGQIYNREYWKIPIYWGGIIGSAHFFMLNRTNYLRFRRIYREATDETATYTGPIPAQTALYYRDVYRRYRDYSVLAMAAFYLLQAIDANVFAYMHDFDVSDDISLNVSPTLIAPDEAYAMATPPAMGVRFGLTF